MSRKRTGSITTTREGRFRVRVTINGERRDLDTYELRDDAERELAAALEIVETDLSDGVLLGEFVEKHLTRRELSREYRAMDAEWSRFNTHVKGDPIAAIPIAALASSDVHAFVGRVRSRVAKTTASCVLQVIRGALGEAVALDLIDRNVAMGVRLRGGARTREPWTFATPAEQDAIVESARRHCAKTSRLRGIPLDAMLDFAMGAGPRAGELVCQRLADVHIDGLGAHGPHVVIRYGTPPSLPTKTGRVRRVPLFGRGLDGARRWIAAMPSWVKGNAHGVLFPASRGGFRDPDHVIWWEDWKAILAGGGITRRFRWHDLRHTCASSLVSGAWGRAWPLIEVRDMMGHTTIKTTERYAHLAESALDRAAKETDAFWPRVSAVDLTAQPENRTILVASGESSQGFRKAPKDATVSRAYETGVRIQSESIALLQAAAAGDGETVGRLGRELARAVLAEHTRLASAVLAGGDTFVASAIELADLLAGDASASSPTAIVGAS